MTDLPRYYIERIDAGRSTFSVDWYESTDGDWVKWGDVSARLQQLEEKLATGKILAERGAKALIAAADEIVSLEAQLQQLEEEKATLQAEKAFAETANEQFADVLRKEYDARKKAEAALAETREALHQVTEKYEDLATRAERRGVDREPSYRDDL